MEILVANIIAGKRKRAINPDKVKELANSIETLGLINPITVKDKGGWFELVTGAHRLEAFKLKGWEKIEANLFDGDETDIELAEIDENLLRNDLTILEQGEHLMRREQILVERGERATADMGKDRGDNLTPLLKTTEIAEEAGMKERTAQRRMALARNICEEARDNIRDHEDVADNQSQLQILAMMEPDKQVAVSEKIKNDEAQNITEARMQMHKDEIHAIQPPTGKYQIIYADPPWDYGQQVENYGPASRHYSTMPTDKIMELPIANLAVGNSALFIWTTAAKIQEGMNVAAAWGFVYKAMFVWDKIKHNFGHYNSVRHEILLLCTRGSYPLENQVLYDSVQAIERNDEHSEKPEEFRKIIETIYPSAKKIELFARKRVEGWDAWGNL